MLTTFKSEFQLKNFKLDDANPAQFYESQWCGNKWFYWVFKLVLLLYWLSWLVAGLVLYENTDTWWTKLTNWGVTIVLMYLLTSFMLVTYGLIVSCTSASIGQKLKTISGTLKDEAETNNNNVTTVRPSSDVQWFHKIVWVLYEVACGLAILITVSYWILLDVNLSAFSINNHLINSILMIIDLSINRISVKLFHFYHLMLFAVVFVSFSLILHGTGVTSAIYPVLDWSQNWKLALGLSLGFIFIVTPIVHFVVYILYSVKMFIVRKINSSCRKNLQKESSTVPSFSTSQQFAGVMNPSFQV